MFEAFHWHSLKHSVSHLIVNLHSLGQFLTVQYFCCYRTWLRAPITSTYRLIGSAWPQRLNHFGNWAHLKLELPSWCFLSSNRIDWALSIVQVWRREVPRMWTRRVPLGCSSIVYHHSCHNAGAFVLNELLDRWAYTRTVGRTVMGRRWLNSKGSWQVESLFLKGFQHASRTIVRHH